MPISTLIDRVGSLHAKASSTNTTQSSNTKPPLKGAKYIPKVAVQNRTSTTTKKPVSPKTSTITSTATSHKVGAPTTTAVTNKSTILLNSTTSNSKTKPATLTIALPQASARVKQTAKDPTQRPLKRQKIEANDKVCSVILLGAGLLTSFRIRLNHLSKVKRKNR